VYARSILPLWKCDARFMIILTCVKLHVGARTLTFIWGWGKLEVGEWCIRDMIIKRGMCSSSSPRAASLSSTFFRDYNKPFVLLLVFLHAVVTVFLAPIREIVCYFQFEIFSSSRHSGWLLPSGLSAWEGGNQPGCEIIRKDNDNERLSL